MKYIANHIFHPKPGDRDFPDRGGCCQPTDQPTTMARVLQPHLSMSHVENRECLKSNTKDVFDSPSVTTSTQQTESTRGMPRARGAVDTTMRHRGGQDEGHRRGKNDDNLISAWRTSSGREDHQNPVERAKARLATWYVFSCHDLAS